MSSVPQRVTLTSIPMQHSILMWLGLPWRSQSEGIMLLGLNEVLGTVVPVAYNGSASGPVTTPR